MQPEHTIQVHKQQVTKLKYNSAYCGHLSDKPNMRAVRDSRKEEMLCNLMIMSTFTEQFMQTSHTHKF